MHISNDIIFNLPFRELSFTNAKFKGGSGGGGGGGSGQVDYPDYMKNVHNDWLDNTGIDTISSSITDVMDSALGNSPWTTQTAYNPDADITAYESALSDFATILAGISDTGDWDTLYTQAVSSIDGVTETEVTADVDAFANQLDDEITTKVLPRFRRGMQDINAVVSSAFPIGEAIIEGFRNREVAKYASGIRLNVVSKRNDLYVSATGQMLQLMMQRIGWEDSYAKAIVEAKRIKIVAKKEEVDVNLKIDESDALWDLEVFQYGANLLASIGGGTVDPNTKQPSTAQSMIGGAMSGAAAGAMIGSMTAAEGATGLAAIGGPGFLIGGAVLGAASALL